MRWRSRKAVNRHPRSICTWRGDARIGSVSIHCIALAFPVCIPLLAVSALVLAMSDVEYDWDDPGEDDIDSDFASEFADVIEEVV